jgi:hypothetical protein
MEQQVQTTMRVRACHDCCSFAGYLLVALAFAAWAPAACRYAVCQGAEFQNAAFQNAAFQNAAFQNAAFQNAVSQATEPADEAKPVPPESAAEHVGKSCVIEMQVRSARRGDTPIEFLNSREDFRDDKNFTVVILEPGLAAFKKAGIAEPYKHFDGKKIRVTGTVELYRDRPQIRVDNPKQIEIVKEPSASSQKTS